MYPYKTQLLKSGLDALYYCGAHLAMEPFVGGLGLFFTLHHIKPANEVAQATTPGFHPNGILEVTPGFLDDVVARVIERGIEPVTMAEAVRRIRDGDDSRRFACFTIDDGYRDNLVHALPVFRKYDCPFTLFVTTSIVDQSCELWWLALEEAIAFNEHVEPALEAVPKRMNTKAVSEKWSTFNRLYDRMRAMDEDEQRVWIKDFSRRHGINLRAICEREALTWDEVRQLAEDPLVTIGAHTVNHFALSKLDPERALYEMRESRARIGHETGTEPDFFCYPYGCPNAAGAREFELARQAGFEAAVTTRKGVLFSEHGRELMALPRVSLNGAFQALRYVDLFVSGAPFALWNRFRRVNAT